MTTPAALAATARALFAGALAECSIASAFARKLHPGPNRLVLEDDASGQPRIELDLTGFTRILVLAAGKAAVPMLDGLLHRLPLPPQCEPTGVLLAPQPPSALPPGVQFFPAGHPLPNAASFSGAAAALSLLDRETAEHGTSNTLCFFLISGGASAMLELPLDRSVSLADTTALHRALVHSGATIAEINCIRKHFSAVKGGRLGQAAAALPSLTILVSDVPPGQLNALGSGPTLPDTSTTQQCHEILARYDLLPRFPASVRRFFASPDLPETPKSGDFTARAFTLLSSADLAEAARRHAESLGFTAVIDNTCDDWDYRAATEYLLDRLRALRRQHPRVCLISAGEVTVHVPTTATGTGGRNQHFVLYAATLLQPADRTTVVFSAGSDGIDGDSRFAGAVLDYDRLQAANAVAATTGRPTAAQALASFDSTAFLTRIGATVETGPTGNNLRDLRLLLSDNEITK